MLDPVNLWVQGVRSQLAPDDLIDELISSGPSVNTLAGRTGIGKTNFALQLAHSVASGVPFLGFKTRKAKVGYLAFEGAKAKTADRLEKLANTFEDTGDNLHFALSPPPQTGRQRGGFSINVRRDGPRHSGPAEIPRPRRLHQASRRPSILNGAGEARV